jgi:chaperonin GroEL
MPKTLINDTKKLFEGFFTVCNAAKQTLGAEGKLAVISAPMLGMPPIVTKDGVTVARNISFPDKEQAKNMGASLAKQVAARTLLKVGDNTTTALVFAQAIVEETDEYFFNKKIEKGMDIAFEEIVENIQKVRKETDDEAIKKIATISSNNNEEIGEILYQAYKIVGEDGVIDVQEADSKANIELVESKGMRLNKGWASPFLINNQKTGNFEANEALVIVYEGYEIHNNDIVKSFITKNSDKPIVLIVERLGLPEWVEELYRVNVQGGYNVTLIEAPDFDVKRTALMEDIAEYVGAEIFVQGISKEVNPGKVDKVIVEQNTTSLIQQTVNEKVLERVENLKAQLENTSEKEFFQKRIQNLEGKSVTILVGGVTPEETKERFDRVDDATKNVKSSIAEGYLVGGGSAMVYISGQMKQKFDNEYVQKGYNILKEAIKRPFLQICSNARVEGEPYIKEIQSKYGMGYNAKTDEFTDLLEDGVIDSAKSLRVALENAKSQAVLLLNTSVVVEM